jgi:hypothetical protein
VETAYIRLPNGNDDAIIDTISELDLTPYRLTTYTVGDYVLRQYPPSKIGKGNQDKYGSHWRGPYLVTKVTSMPQVYSPEGKTWYTIQNLVTTKESHVDVKHIRPFFFDPKYVTPLNIAAKDSDEHVVKKILAHDFSDPTNKKWRVLWVLDEDNEEETWEPLEVLKHVEAFNHYCATHRLNVFQPTKQPEFSASTPHGKRLTQGKVTLPILPPDQVPATSTIPKP